MRYLRLAAWAVFLLDLVVLLQLLYNLLILRDDPEAQAAVRGLLIAARADAGRDRRAADRQHMAAQPGGLWIALVPRLDTAVLRDQHDYRGVLAGSPAPNDNSREKAADRRLDRFALDLAILLLMIRALATAEFSDDDRDFAVSLTWTFALWVGAVNAALLAGWWRDSRATLWIALIGGGLPLLWAWTLAIQAITDAATAPQ